MSLKDDLVAEVAGIFRASWSHEKANVIPAPNDLLLNSNHAKLIEQATVLYADIDGSTNMVDTYDWAFSAEVYKAYLRCAGELVRSHGGQITAYDGDRVMAVFTGERNRTRAVLTALRINWAVLKVINPAIQTQYTGSNFTLKHVIGIDTSSLHVSRIGVHGDNDLVWVGKAANHAAKLCSLTKKTLWITKAVYDGMADDAKFGGTPKTNMWSPYKWNTMNEAQIYGSNWQWEPPN